MAILSLLLGFKICSNMTNRFVKPMNIILYFKMIFLVNFISYGHVRKKNADGKPSKLKAVSQSRRVSSNGRTLV